MFGKRRKHTALPAGSEAVLQVSICTGETTAGFEDKSTGRFTGVQVIRNEKDLRDFLSQYGLKGPLRKIY